MQLPKEDVVAAASFEPYQYSASWNPVPAAQKIATDATSATVHVETLDPFVFAGTSKVSSKVLYFDGGYVYSTNAQSLIRYLVNFSDLDNAPKPIAEITMFCTYVDISGGFGTSRLTPLITLAPTTDPEDPAKTVYYAYGHFANNGPMYITNFTFTITYEDGTTSVCVQQGNPAQIIKTAQTMVAHIDEPVMSIIDPEMRERTWMAFYYYPSDVTFESASFGSGRIMNAAARDNSTYTYQYFITDHLGSTRMVVDGNGVPLEATEYYPYGTMVPVAPSANPEVPAREQFTGKEFDTEGEDVANGAPGIQCYYFGARYYDPEVGVWGSCDKAGQFASGYGYGTNPVIMVDEDGNFVFIPILIAMASGAAIGAGVGGATYAFSAGGHGNFSWSGLGKQMVFGAIGGAVTGGFGSMGTSLATNMFYSALGNGASYGLTSAIAGNQMSAGGVGAALLGGAIGGLMPTYAGLNNLSGGALASNATRSIGGEILYGAGKGALMGGLSASIETGDIRNFGKGAGMGALAGGLGTAALIGYSGRLYNTGYEKKLSYYTGGKSQGLWNKGFRSGGVGIEIEKIFEPKTEGVYSPLTGQITIGNNTASNVAHEFSHYLDVTSEGVIPQELNYGRYEYRMNPYELRAQDYAKWFELSGSEMAY